jgi:hypothetical protein
MTTSRRLIDGAVFTARIMAVRGPPHQHRVAAADRRRDQSITG